MPNFSGPGGMKDVNLIAQISNEALADKERKNYPVNVGIDPGVIARTKKGEPTAAAKKALSEELKDAHAGRPSLVSNVYKDKNGVERVGYNAPYSASQVDAMLKAGGKGVAKDDKSTYIPFKASVLPTGKGNYVVDTSKPMEATRDKPLDIDAYKADMKTRAEIFRGLHPKTAAAGIAGPEVEAQAEL